jgi:hypothetical protein
VEAAFQVAEQHGDRLDPPLVGQVFQPFLLDDMNGHAVLPLLLRLEVQLLKLGIAEHQEFTQ